MATALQEDLAEAVVRNKMLPRYKRKNKKELVVSVGYSPKVADKKATATIEAKGVQDAIAKQGLTKEFITEALIDDIQNKPRKRFLELNLGAEILGMKIKLTDVATVQNVTNNLTQIIINPPSHAVQTRNQSDTEAVSGVASATEQ